MISIQSIVETILKKDAEAYIAMKRGIMNYSQYAHSIHGEVEDKCKKEVRHGSIVIALTRIAEAKRDGLIKTYAPRIELKNITTKMPTTKITYTKTPETIVALETLFKKVNASLEDFFVMTLSTEEITIICSDTLIEKVESAFALKPKMKQGDLAAVGLSFDEKYYNTSNVNFSLVRKLALRQINIAEMVSTYTGVTFICHQKDLGEVLEAFSKK